MASWVLVVSGYQQYRSIDYVTGMLMVTQILVKTLQPGTERCMFMYEVRVGPRSCDHPIDDSVTAYRTKTRQPMEISELSRITCPRSLSLASGFIDRVARPMVFGLAHCGRLYFVFAALLSQGSAERCRIVCE